MTFTSYGCKTAVTQVTHSIMFQAGSVEIKILHESISEYKLDLAATV